MIGHSRVSFAIVDFMLTFRTMCEKQNKLALRNVSQWGLLSNVSLHSNKFNNLIVSLHSPDFPISAHGYDNAYVSFFPFV